jgi:hypothetical protein
VIRGIGADLKKHFELASISIAGSRVNSSETIAQIVVANALSVASEIFTAENIEAALEDPDLEYELDVSGMALSQGLTGLPARVAEGARGLVLQRVPARAGAAAVPRRGLSGRDGGSHLEGAG